MRKLLVASQKGGVGKTTTSMNLAAALTGTRVLLLDADPLSNVSTALNLAEHPQRQSLRQASIELPGVLVANLVPGLDVLSPYDDGHCSDGDFDRLLQALTTPAVQHRYGCLIVDAPPFLGANPAQLISSCDEFLLVMRAEAMAYRTLPAFLELVQRSRRDGHALPMRGILLTLPEGEEPDSRVERELRGRFGARVLPEVIPYDDTIGKALHVGQIASHLHPESPAAKQYRWLAGKLGLAEESRPAATVEQVVQTLCEAAAVVQPAAVAAAPVSVDPPRETKDHSAKGADLFDAAPEPKPVKPAAPSSHRPRRLGRSGETLRPARLERPAAPAVSSSSSPRMKPAAANVPSRAPPVPPVAVGSPTVNTNEHALGQLWPLWILLGAVLGGGLRFLPLSPSLLPYLVGFGVAVLVVVALRTIAMVQQDKGTVSSNDGQTRPQEREAKEISPRPETKKDPAARLASLTAKAVRRDPRAN